MASASGEATKSEAHESFVGLYAKALGEIVAYKPMKVPFDVSWTAFQIFWRFFQAQSALEHDPKVIMIASLALAAKVQEARQLTLGMVLQAANLRHDADLRSSASLAETTLLQGLQFNISFGTDPELMLRQLLTDLKGPLAKLLDQGENQSQRSAMLSDELRKLAKEYLLAFAARNSKILQFQASLLAVAALLVSLEELGEASSDRPGALPQKMAARVRDLVRSAATSQVQGSADQTAALNKCINEAVEALRIPDSEDEPELEAITTAMEEDFPGSHSQTQSLLAGLGELQDGLQEAAARASASGRKRPLEP